MAYRFSQEKTSDMTGFKNFLEGNKAGTFLENAVFELSQTHSANDTLTITLGNSEVKFIADSSRDPNQILKYTGKYKVFSISSITKYGAAMQYFHMITTAMLGNNGLLLGYHGSTTNIYTIVATKYPIMLTIDSVGDLAVVAYTGSAVGDATYSEYHVFSYNSPSAPTSYAYPNYSASLTSLAQIAPYTDETPVTLPYAYAAVHTQVSGEGLTEIVMDGKNYITNGYWYVME